MVIIKVSNMDEGRKNEIRALCIIGLEKVSSLEKKCIEMHVMIDQHFSELELKEINNQRYGN
jgi:hypothetical protein